jgi:repressor LexA
LTDLSERQQQILTIIKKAVAQKGYPPTVREIGLEVGLRSSATVHSHMHVLEEKGYIRRDPAKPRALEILELGNEFGNEDNEFDNMTHRVLHIPIIGHVAAGEPIFAEENIEDTFPVPYEMVRTDTAFILTVKGESMIEAGILDGDYLLVRSQDTARNGQIVVALLDQEVATVKRFFRERGLIRLQPENSTMSPIFTKAVTIVGVVIGLFRTVV